METQTQRNTQNLNTNFSINITNGRMNWLNFGFISDEMRLHCCGCQHFKNSLFCSPNKIMYQFITSHTVSVNGTKKNPTFFKEKKRKETKKNIYWKNNNNNTIQFNRTSEKKMSSDYIMHMYTKWENNKRNETKWMPKWNMPDVRYDDGSFEPTQIDNYHRHNVNHLIHHRLIDMNVIMFSVCSLKCFDCMQNILNVI